MKIDYVFTPHLLSTQCTIKEMSMDYPNSDFLVLYTDFQEQGRGQKGNHWEAQKGKNLLFSILCRPSFLQAHNLFLLSKAVSLGITDVLSSFLPISIKWPNDIYVRDKKIAGILIESDWHQQHITSCRIGIGLNVNQKHFYSDAPNPTSLLLELRRSFHRKILLKKIINSVFQRYQMLNMDKIQMLEKNYHDILYRKMGYHYYKDQNGNIFQARITKVSHDGGLHLEDTNGKEKIFYFKEISYC